MRPITSLDDEFDDTPLTFGKYRGKTPEEISDIDPGYIVWMAENIEEQHCSNALYQFCLKEIKRGK